MYNNGDGRVKLFILISLVVALFMTLGCYKFFNTYVINENNGSIIYTSALKYTLPVANSGNKSSDSKCDIREILLESLGLNIYNPISIVQKEMPFLYGNLEIEEEHHGDEHNENTASIAINPFKLSEQSITKSGDSVEPPKPIENVNVGEISNNKIKKTLDKNKPEVLIYHTHIHESYGKEVFNNDFNKNMAAIGDEVAKNLEETYGIATLHDKTINDAMYNSAYGKSRQTLDTYLKKYNNFKVILDIHRDSGPSRTSCLTKMNGEDVATMRLVVSKNRPNINENMKMVNSIMEISKRLYPSVTHDVFYYNHGNSHFNQDKSPNAILIEVGSDKNDFNEAKATGKYIARILAEYINKK